MLDNTKRYSYKWDQDIWLLHLSVESNHDNSPITITRTYENGSTQEEVIEVKKDARFIITRETPKEVAVGIEYRKDIACSLYEVLDRAHYPINPIYSK